MDKTIRKPSSAKKAVPLHLKLLKEELNRRTRMNPHYSLRAFARQLEIDPSLLSKIMVAKRKLSLSYAKQILKKCALSPSEKKLFWNSFVHDKENLGQVFDDETASVMDMGVDFNERQLSQSTFQLIAEPHHYTLTETLRIKGVKKDVPTLAKRLNLSLPETRESLDRLVRVGMIKKDGEVYVRSNGRFTTDDKAVTDSALKHHQRKLLETAASALEHVDLDRRSQNSMTIAINPKRIPLAKKMIEDFVNQLSIVLESGELEEVYHLTVGLFPSEGKKP